MKEETVQKRKEAGKAQAVKDIDKIKNADCIKNADDYRIIGSPYRGRWASERKISLLAKRGKIGEIRCGYSSYYDVAYFAEMLAFVQKAVNKEA